MYFSVFVFSEISHYYMTTILFFFKYVIVVTAFLYKFVKYCQITSYVVFLFYFLFRFLSRTSTEYE